MICPNCLYQGNPKFLAKGSFAILVILLIIFFPLGIIYAIACSTGPKNICPKCDSVLIADDSARGIELLKRDNAEDPSNPTLTKMEQKQDIISPTHQNDHTPQKPKDSERWLQAIGITGIVVVFIFIIAQINNKGASLTAPPKENKPTIPQTPKTIPYQVRQIEQTVGVVNFFILEHKNVTIKDLTTLGKELHNEYKDTPFIRISIYDDAKAVEMRDKVTNDTASKSEVAFYDLHYVAQYNKNENTKYEQFAIYRDGSASAINKIINY